MSVDFDMKYVKGLITNDPVGSRMSQDEWFEWLENPLSRFRGVRPPTAQLR